MHRIPPRRNNILKQQILVALRGYCKHPDIEELLSAELSEFDDVLLRALMSIVPCCPMLISALWECSPTYLVGELIAKFLQSQTIVAVLMLLGRRSRFRGKDPPVLLHMVKAHNNIKRYWADVLRLQQEGRIHLFGGSCTAWPDPRIFRYIGQCNKTMEPYKC